MFTPRNAFLVAAGILAAGGAIATASDDNEPPIHLPSESEFQFSENPYAGHNKLDMITSGLAHLVAIRYGPGSLSSQNSAYTGVYGDFCVYDNTLNKEGGQSLFPTVEDMIETSDHCSDHTFTLQLDEVVAAVSSSHDAANFPSLSGAIFHEAHAGASLVSNTLTTFVDTLVIAEHPAIHDALAVCDQIRNTYLSDDCSSSQQKQLVADVMKLATRSSNPSITRAYIKFHSDSTAYIPIFREIFPHVPWTFHYRDHQTVLAKSTESSRSPCVFTGRNPSSTLAQKAQGFHLDLDSMSREDLCALYLSTLLEVATLEFKSSDGTGMLVPYEQLLKPNYMRDDILPHLGFQAEIDADSATVSANVKEILSIKSNTHGGPGHHAIPWDAGKDAVNITPKVSAASKLFMDEAMAEIGRL